MTGRGRDTRRRAAARRAAIPLLGLAVLAAAAGCSGPDHPASLPLAGRPAVPSTDDLAQLRAVQDARSLFELATAVAAAGGRVGRTAATVRANEQAHLAALGVGAPAGPVPAPRLARPSARLLVTALGERSRAGLNDLDGVQPGTATLLARIAAGRAGDALLLARAAGLGTPDPPVVPGSPLAAADRPAAVPAGTTSGPALAQADTDALGALLAGEHAAVFGYAMVTARLDGGRRPAAERAWLAHQNRRDALERYLIARGAQPPAAAAAYDLGPLPQTPDQAEALAVRIEDNLAAAAAGALGPASGAVRPAAATILLASARTATGWSGKARALPGGPAVAASPAASPAPSPAAGTGSS